MNDLLIDFHSHILPGMDDGAKNIEESLAMLKIMHEYGTKTVIATPHFYPTETPEEFNKRREKALKTLLENRPSDYPKIAVGSETLYYSGISNNTELDKLSIKGTNVLLLEMPFSKWNENIVEDILRIKQKGFDVVIAHIERFIPLQSKKLLNKLYSEEVYIQINAEYIIKHPHFAKKLINSDSVQFIGTDSHNCNERKPNLREAFDKLGPKYSDFITYENHIFDKVFQNAELY